jgi:hypothetical protein
VPSRARLNGEITLLNGQRLKDVPRDQLPAMMRQCDELRQLYNAIFMQLASPTKPDYRELRRLILETAKLFTSGQ